MGDLSQIPDASRTMNGEEDDYEDDQARQQEAVVQSEDGEFQPTAIKR